MIYLPPNATWWLAPQRPRHGTPPSAAAAPPCCLRRRLHSGHRALRPRRLHRQLRRHDPPAQPLLLLLRPMSLPLRSPPPPRPSSRQDGPPAASPHLDPQRLGGRGGERRQLWRRGRRARDLPHGRRRAAAPPGHRDAAAAAPGVRHPAGSVRGRGRRGVRPLLRHRRVRAAALARVGGRRVRAQARPPRVRPAPRRPRRPHSLGALRGGRDEGGGDGGGAAGVRAARHVGGAAPARRPQLRGGGQRAHPGLQRQASGSACRAPAGAARRRHRVLRRLQGDDRDDHQPSQLRIRRGQGGVLRAGPIQGDDRVPQQADGVPHPSETRVVGPVRPHRGSGLPSCELVLVAGGWLLRPEHEHLPSRHSAAAGRPCRPAVYHQQLTAFRVAS